MAFLTQNKAKLCKMLVIRLVFEKNAYYFAENCRKSQKIVIITSAPDSDDFSFAGNLFESDKLYVPSTAIIFYCVCNTQSSGNFAVPLTSNYSGSTWRVYWWKVLK
jgi:hypothetical protein